MKTEQGLELLMAPRPASDSVRYRVKGPVEIRRESLADFTRRLDQFVSLADRPPLSSTSLISTLYGKDGVESDLRDVPQFGLMPAAQRLCDEGGLPKAMVVLIIHASEESRDDNMALTDIKEIIEGIDPEVDYSSFEKKFSAIRTNAAASRVRGPKAAEIIKLIRSVPDVKATGDIDQILDLKIALEDFGEATSSIQNESAIRAARLTLEGEHHRASLSLCAAINASHWNPYEQSVKDLRDTLDIVMEINREAETDED